MRKTKLVDCTLRDGGYVNEHRFTSKQILHMIQFLAISGVDIIEVGYFRRNQITNDLGIAAWCPDDLLANLPNPASTQLAVMVRPGAASPRDILELRNTAISWMRIPVTLSNVKLGIELGQSAREIGMSVSLNIIRASELNKQAINSLVNAIRSFEPDVVYYADSNSAMFPEQVSSFFGVVREITTCPLGFHAHDGLHFSVANCWCALQEGATWVDGSIGGLGKGGGNAPTEALLALLRQIDGRDIQISALLDAVEPCQAGLFPSRFLARLKGVVYALLDYNIDDIREFETQMGRVPKAIDGLLHKSELVKSSYSTRCIA